MRVRFVPETIYQHTWDNHPFPRYIEREMDFLPPKDIKIKDVTSKRGYPFFSLLNQYDWDTIISMAEFCEYEDYGWRQDWIEIESMTKDDFLDKLWNSAIGYNWKIKRMFYDLNENAYYCIVELDKRKKQ